MCSFWMLILSVVTAIHCKLVCYIFFLAEKAISINIQSGKNCVFLKKKKDEENERFFATAIYFLI